MTYETVTTSRFTELQPGELIDKLDANIKALVGIDSSGEYGGIPTLDNVPGTLDIDDVGEFSPGVDRVDNLAIAESLASKNVIAYKGRGEDHAREYHTLVEYGSRYLNASGEHSLHSLARIALATVLLAAKSEGAELDLQAVSDGQKPFGFHDESTQRGTWAMKKYDAFTQSVTSTPNPSGTRSALSEGLNNIIYSDDLDENSDVCIVVSDFLGGAEYSPDGNLLGFEWQQPLRQLHTELGDRLLVTRLMTQAQREIPPARTILYQGKPTKLDRGDYLDLSERYQRVAKQKAESIRSILRGMRLLELDASDSAPLITVPRFVFAKQEVGA